ncbi:MAG: S41 family peptidase [Lachnospiraceae bacterium]|nr:S41 family peptidase [Lachnospiraceae bacterium]
MLEENQEEIQNQLPETEQDSVKKEKKKHPFRNGFLSGVAVCLVIALMVVIVKETMLHSTVGSGFMTKHGVEKVNLLSDVIDQYYYKDITDEEKMEGIYKGLMSSTNDKYTDYYSPKEFKDLMVTMEGDYGGIGATLSQDKVTKEVSVVEVYEGSPAARAGLERGDIVISVDGHLGTDESLDDFVQRIRGEEGTSIEMVYKRGDQEKTIEITREEVIVPSVSHRMLDDKIGYIRISSFVNGTQKDFEDALADLQSQGMQGIVFDMRDNGGGMVDSVVAILDDILPAGTVVYTMDKSGKREDYTSDDAKKIDIPVTVLVNENTASAAEIFTGAIRDFNYGTIIGTNTFGKGIVQSTVPLSDGSAVKITVATYYTPSGECIHEKGIKPDIELEFSYADENPTEYDELKDNQVQKAMEVLGEKLAD